MTKITVRDRSMENPGGELSGHTAVAPPDANDYKSPRLVLTACCEDGGPAVALKPGEKPPCDSVFRGTTTQGLPRREAIEKSNSHYVAGPQNPSELATSVSRPNYGYRNVSEEIFPAPGIPEKPGQG